MHDGKTIPQLGLGVYEMTDAEAERAVYDALDVGYRHVDSAEWYENEQACGKGINRFLSEKISGRMVRSDTEIGRRSCRIPSRRNPRSDLLHNQVDDEPRTRTNSRQSTRISQTMQPRIHRSLPLAFADRWTEST